MGKSKIKVIEDLVESVNQIPKDFRIYHNKVHANI